MGIQYISKKNLEINVEYNRAYQAITGACLAIIANDFESLNGFDTSYINGLEDIDLCLRLNKLKASLCWCAANSKVMHHESMSFGRLKHTNINKSVFEKRFSKKIIPDDINYYNQDAMIGYDLPEGKYHNVMSFGVDYFFENKGVEVGDKRQVGKNVLTKYYWVGTEPKKNDIIKKNICLFVMWNNEDKFYLYEKELIKSIANQEISVIAIINKCNFDKIVKTNLLGSDFLLVRENIGFDFGAWSHIINIIPAIWSANSILFVNNSFYGNLYKSSYTISSILNSSYDVIGLTDSYEYQWHIQSYFFILKNTALSNLRLRKFWSSMTSFDQKDDVIKHYELEMTHFFRSVGLKVKVIFPSCFLNKKENPLHDRWKELISKGFPFVKKELLHKNPKALNLEGFFDFLSNNIDIRGVVYEDIALEMVKNSQLYDAQYYLTTYPDLKECDNTMLHYLLFGYKESRNPSEEINSAKYMERYITKSTDCVYSNNPIIHYNIIGKSKGFILPKVNIDKSSKLKSVGELSIHNPIIIEDLPITCRNILNIAVVVHIHYIDLLDEIIDTINPIKSIKKVFVTISDLKKEKVINSKLKEGLIKPYSIKSGFKRGRDILPFITQFCDEYKKYDLICKIHGKRSPHLGDFGEKWRKYLFRALLGESYVVEKIEGIFLENSKLGVLMPVPMQGTTNNTWDNNKAVAKSILKQKDIDPKLIDHIPLCYPSATMFWFRPEALEKIYFLYSEKDFPEEPIPEDGTIAHALERLIPYFAISNGYYSSVYWTKYLLNKEKTNEAIVLTWLSNNSSRRKLIIVSHDASNTGAPRTAISLLSHFTQEYDYDCLSMVLNDNKDKTLINEFYKYSPVVECYDDNLDDSFRYIAARKDIVAICNTVISSKVLKLFSELGIKTLSLIHEFASTELIPNNYFESAITLSNKVVYPAKLVLNDTLNNLPHLTQYIDKITIRPQGLYNDSFPLGDKNSSYKSVREELGLCDDAFIIMACGAAESRKGFDFFVDIAKLACSSSQGKNLAFVWLGAKGADETFFQENISKVKNLVESNRFCFLGVKRNVDKYYLASDVFLLTSRLDPFPGVVLEAMASALPVICFHKATGVADVLEDNHSGFAVSIGDIKAVTEKLLLFYNNEDMRNEYGKRNINLVKKKYMFKQYCKDISLMIEGFFEKKNLGVKISVVVPVYNPPLRYLQQMIESITSQSYANWELCIADGSDNLLVKEIINYYVQSDSRIKVIFLDKNLGISGNTNKALDLSTGDYIGFFDHDDLLTKDCLWTIAKAVLEHRPDFIYTMEDKTDESGVVFFDPVKKPNFSLDKLRTHNYITHFSVLSRKVYEQVGYLNSEYDGAQDYDYILRIVEKTNNIHFIDEVLYHWRVFEGSTAGGDADVKPYVVEAGRKALEAHLVRTNTLFRSIENSFIACQYIIKY